MEVISFNDGLLTNIEVAELIESVRSRRVINSYHSPNSELNGREAIESQVVRYVRKSTLLNLSSQSVAKFGKSIKDSGTDLTEPEILQLLNHFPSHPAEVYLMIDECADRLNEDDVNNILAIADSFLKA